MILLQLVGLSCWGTGVTLRLVDLFQKPLNSKNKFRGDYSTLYHLHNLSISNTSHIVKCVCLYICLLKGLGSKDKLWQWCGLYLTLSKGKYLLFGCIAFHKRKTECLHETFLPPLHRLCRTCKKKRSNSDYNSKAFDDNLFLVFVYKHFMLLKTWLTFRIKGWNNKDLGHCW